MAVIVVTGANSGIGRATAVHLAAAGHTVHAAMRDLGKEDKLQEEAGAVGGTVHPLELDVSDDGSVRDGIQRVLDVEDRIDVLEDWLGLGSAADDDEYFDRFERAFGLDIRAGDIRTDEQRAAGL